MRNLIPITTEYIHPSRSIDILHLEVDGLIKQVYIYNYEGLHFHYFDNLIRLIQFFEEGLEPNRSFYCVRDLEFFFRGLRSVEIYFTSGFEISLSTCYV